MRIKAGYVFYLLICLIFTAVFIWLFIQGADWQEILRIAKASKISYLFMSVLALVPGFYIRIWRWTYILNKHNNGITSAQCALPYLSAFAINNLLPFRLGDIARVTLFNKQLTANYATVTSSLLIERILDFLSLLMIFCASFLYLGGEQIHNPVINYIFIIAAIAVTAIGLFLGFSGWVTRLLETLHTHSLNGQMTVVSRAINFVRAVADSIYLHNSPGSVMVLLAASLSIWLMEALVFWLVAQSMGLTLATMESFYVMSLSTFSTLLPSTPGYVGTFHYLCRFSMEQTGIASGSAIFFSLLTHMVIILPVTIIGGAGFIYHFGGAWKNKITDSLRTKLAAE